MPRHRFMILEHELGVRADFTIALTDEGLAAHRYPTLARGLATSRHMVTDDSGDLGRACRAGRELAQLRRRALDCELRGLPVPALLASQIMACEHEIATLGGAA